MKRLAAFVLVVAVDSGIAQEPPGRLEVTLPDWEWTVPVTSPPLFEREGVVAADEQPFWRELWPLLRDGRNEEALDLFRRDYVLLDDMEQGTVHGPVTHGEDMSAALYYLLGHAYSSLEENLAAETAFRSALEHLPDYIRVHESLGLLYIGEQRYAEARVHLSRAAELGLNTASLYGSLGFLNQATDNPWGAVSAYQQAMMLDGDNVQWQRGLLHALNQSRNYASALALVEELLQRNEGDTDLWIFRAHLAQQTGDEATALASLETAIRLGDGSVANYQVCATLHMQIGSVARATELIQLGLVAGMDFVFFDQALAWLIRQSEWDHAEALIDDVRPAFDDLDDSRRSRLLTHSAGIAVHNGETEAARAALEQALDLDASNAEALMELAALYERDGDYGRAELLYQRASAFEAHLEAASLAMAQLAIDQNRYERALELLREIVQRNPQRADLRRNIEILENLAELRSDV